MPKELFVYLYLSNINWWKIMSYKNLKIQNFRGIGKLEIEDFGKVNLFVGKNNCGKTSVLESLYILTGPVNAELPMRTNLFRGYNLIEENTWRLIFNNLNIESYVSISGNLENPSETRNIKIRTKTSPSYVVETKTIDNEDLDKVKISSSGTTPTINGLILEYFVSDKTKKLSKKFVTEFFKEAGEIRTSRPPKDYKETLRGLFLNPKTLYRDSVQRFSNIQIRKQTGKIIDILKQMEPSLSDLSLGADGIIYCDIGFKQLIPINVMGDGMYRLLSIVAGIFESQDGVAFIDEIDNGFHYTSQELLWKVIFKAAKEFNVQIFATTHTIECVKAFNSSYSTIKKKNEDEARLYRIECKEGKHNAVIFDYDTLKTSLERGWEVR